MRPGDYNVTTPTANLRANEPHLFELTGLAPDAGYSYRLRFRIQGNGEFLDSAPGDFRTQRARGSEFTFAIQADSHMGAMTRHQKWCPTCGRELADDVTFANTMINLVKYNPDFVVDLGDTFMTSQNFGNGLFEIQNRQPGAPIREIDVVGDFLLLRGYQGQSAYTVPLFLLLGNHDTERQSGWMGRPTTLRYGPTMPASATFRDLLPTNFMGEASKKFRTSAVMMAGTRGSGEMRCSWPSTPSGTRLAGGRGAGL